MIKYRREISVGLLIVFLATFFILSTPDAFARESGFVPASTGDHVSSLKVDGTRYGVVDDRVPLGGDKKDDCNWLCRLLRFLGTAAQIAIDVLVLVCKYNPKYCVI